MPSKTPQIGVACSSCSWTGRRVEVGTEPCPNCGGVVRARARRASDAVGGRRTRVVVHVLPNTAAELEREREETGAVGIGTVGSQVLDAWAKGRKR